MRIVIDLQGAQSNSRFRGIGRYSLALAQGIIRNRGNHEVIIVLNGMLRESIPAILEFFAPILPRDNIRIWYAAGPVLEMRKGTELRRESAELIREAFIASLHPDIVHISSLFEGFGDSTVTSISRFLPNDKTFIQAPVSVSFYDLIPFINQLEYFDKKPDYETNYLRKIEDLKKASLLLAISEFSRAEGIEYLHFPAQKIVNISSAADDFFTDKAPSTAPDALLEKYQITKPFILYTGGADPRKNLKSLLIAYSRLPHALRQEHQLVLAGTIAKEELPHLQKTIKENGLADDEVIFTDYISDQELHTLYFTCKLFVFPSWHEGFGLPALEAMKSGAAVIASNTTSLPEVVNIEEALFDPRSIESIATKMQAGLSDESLRARLIDYGKEKAQEFSWDITAKKALAAFEALHANYPTTPTHQSNDVIRTELISQLTTCVFPRHRPQEDDFIRLAACIGQNFPSEHRRPQFLIDISQLVTIDEKTGIQRVVRSLIAEFIANPPENYDVKLVYSDRFSLGYRYANQFMQKMFGSNISKQKEDEIQDEVIETQMNDIFLGLDLQSENIQVQKQFLNAIHLNGTRIYFVVYDLLPLYFPKAFPETVDYLHAQWLKQISKYDGIFCISKAVADEFTYWAKKNIPSLSPSFTVNWFHLGADIENSVPTKGMPANAPEIIAKIKSRPSFIMIGTIEPRKGYRQSLAAFEALWAKGVDVNLVIIGKHGWLMDEFANNLPKHPEFNHHFFWLDRISDEYLEAVYAAGTCLFLASEGEGFGLPLIEAARRHLPIIARDIPVFREVAGEYAFYFQSNPLDESAAIASAIESWLELFKLKQHPPSSGMPWLTWKQSALSIIKNLLK